MQLSLVLFGPMTASGDGQPISFATQMKRALLSYLAVETDRPHARERLAALLWLKHTYTAAAANFRQMLARLRRALPERAPRVLHITPHTLQFTSGATATDVARFAAFWSRLSNVRTVAHVRSAGLRPGAPMV